MTVGTWLRRSIVVGVAVLGSIVLAAVLVPASARAVATTCVLDGELRPSDSGPASFVLAFNPRAKT
jgi:hypothetical protein